MWKALGGKCILAFLACIVLSEANFLHVIPKVEIKPWVVLHSDGTMKEITGQKFKGCGVGPGIIYLPIVGAQSNTQSCYDDNYIRFQRGTVNQVDTDTNRMFFAGSDVTYVGFDWYQKATATLRLAARYGWIYRGSDTPPGIHATGTLSSTWHSDTKVKSYTGTAGSTIRGDRGWHICDSSIVSCSDQVVVQSGVSYYFAFGAGVKMIIVGSLSDIGKDKSLHDAIYVQDPHVYLTSSSDSFHIVPIPIAIEVESWMEHGSPSIHGLLIDKLTEPARKKRQAALALAIANRVELESVKKANRAAAAISDKNNNKLADQGFQLEVADAVQAVNLARMTKRYQALKKEVRTSNREVRYLRDLAANLGQKQRAIDITLLKVARFLQLTETMPDEHLAQVREQVKNETNGNIILEYSDADNYYFVVSEDAGGRPVVTNDPEALCGSTFCHHKGNWTQIRGVGISVSVEGPLVAAMSCGLFLKDATETQIAVLVNQPDSTQRLAYFQANNADLIYSYGNPRDCFDEDVLANTLLNTARLQLEAEGFDAIRIDENDKFFINCSENITQSFTQYMEKNSLCDRRMQADEFLTNALALTPHRVEVESSLDAFNAIMEQENEIGTAFKNLLSGTASTFAEAAGIAQDSWDYAFSDKPKGVEKKVNACLALVCINFAGNVAFGIFIILKVRTNSEKSTALQKQSIELDTLEENPKKQQEEKEFSIE